MASEQKSSEALLSIRTSCNRCRNHKLKCVVAEAPDGTVCCQRCIRAIVPCTFGRRERKRRGSPPRIVPQIPWMPSPLEVPSTPMQNIYPNTDSMDMGRAETMVLHGTNAFPFPNVSAEASAEQILNGDHGTTSSSLNMDISLDTHDMEADAANEYNFPPLTHVQLLGAHHTQQWHFQADEWRMDLPSDDADAPLDFSAIMSPKAASTALLQLAADLQERLDFLENEPSWRRKNASMDKYPIGSVLQLASKLQQLGRHLQTNDSSSTQSESSRSRTSTSATSSTHEQQMPVTESGSSDTHLYMSHLISATRFDTSVSLMLLSCFVTLLQISTGVLGHFQDYLHTHPRASTRTLSMSSAQSYIVSLGDLGPQQQIHDRIHTAIYVLLNSLEEVEEALCLPPRVRLASTLQTAPKLGVFSGDQENVMSNALCGGATGGIEDILADFGRRVSDTKGMLRQHMDL